MTDEEVIEQFLERIEESRKSRKDWADEAREAFKVYDGHQWDPEDLGHLRSQNRPAVTFNRVAPAVDSITGYEINNRQEARFYPRTTRGPLPTDVDEPGVEMLTEVCRYIRQTCDAAEEESDAFRDSLISGIGWSRTRIDDETPNNEIVIERVDPFKMFWDPAANKRNLVDARWVCCAELYSRSELRERWPDKFDEIQRAITDDAGQDPHNADEDWKYEGEASDSQLFRRNLYRVYEYQWVQVEKAYKWNSPDTDPNTVDELSAKERNKLVASYTKMSEDADKAERNWARLENGEDIDPGMTPEEIEQSRSMVATYAGPLAEAVEVRRRVVYRAYIAGRSILEKIDQSPAEDSFTYHPITYKRDQTKHTWYGLLRSMKDPQDWANKFFSQMQDIMQTNAKGGYLAERDAVANVAQFEKQIAQPGSIAWLNPGGMSKVQAKGQGQFPAILDRLLDLSINGIRDVSGINVEMIGYGSGANTPGVTVSQRIRQGFAILAPFFDAIRLYRKQQGRVLLTFIRKYMADQEIRRVVGTEMGEAIPFSKDKMAAHYDVIIDEAPASPNRKLETWAIIQQLLPTLAGMGVPPNVWFRILEESPLPMSLARDLIAAAQANPQAQTESPPPQQQGGMAPGGRPPEQ